MIQIGSLGALHGASLASGPVRHPGCVPESPGACGATYVEDSLSHCCRANPRHAGVHGCRCGREWEEAQAQQTVGACGVTRQLGGAGHACVCRLAVHNLVTGPDMVERSLHACVHCQGAWAT